MDSTSDLTKGFLTTSEVVNEEAFKELIGAAVSLYGSSTARRR
jgi:hypothetical protein